MSKEETFLSRWSRRKVEARDLEKTPESQPPVVDESAEAPEPAVPVAEEVVPSEKAEEPPELPDIESLTKDSDYSAFMRPDVDPGLRNKALSKLWRSDPVYANVDGLNDYDGDFRNPAVVGAAVRTVYNVMTGYSHLLKPKEEDGSEATPDQAVVDEEHGVSADDGAPNRMTETIKPHEK